MSISVCPKCNNNSFKIESVTTVNGEDIILAISCYICHAMIGTVADTAELDNKLSIINNNIGQLMRGVKHLSQEIKTVKSKLD